jgi:hypothetical protein
MLSTSHEETTSYATTKPDNNETTTHVKHERPRAQNYQRKRAHRPNSTLEICSRSSHRKTPKQTADDLTTDDITTTAPPSAPASCRSGETPPQQHLQEGTQCLRASPLSCRRIRHGFFLCLPTSRYATEGHGNVRPCDQMTKHHCDKGPWDWAAFDAGTGRHKPKRK